MTSESQHLRMLRNAKNNVKEFEIPRIKERSTTFEFLDLTPKSDHFQVANESGHSNRNKFEIDDIVSKNRGHFQYELDQKELQISQEVERRVKALEDESRNRGYSEGRETAKNEIFSQLAAQIKLKLEEVEVMVEEILSLRDRIVEESRQDVFRTVNAISKWMLNKYLDKDSIIELIKRSFHEIGTEQSILIKMDPQTFENKEEIFKALSEEFGELKHIRFYCDEAQLRPGYQIEMDNVLVDGSFESQIKKIDVLFEKLSERKNESGT
jgi:flagellar biosynthesis/type III secretory pathway protein FliH